MEPESGFRSCNKKHTKWVGSIYPREKIPNEMFEKSNGGYYVTCSDCRKHHAKQEIKSKDKIKKELGEIDHKSEFRSCTSKHTKCVNSIYPRSKVPNKMFEKSNGEYYVTCSDCRKHNATQQSVIKKKNNNKIREELIEKDGESEFRSCNPHLHTKCVDSPYPVDKVPTKMFEKSNGQYHKYCLDCRKYAANQKNIRSDKKKNDDMIKKELIEKDCESEFFLLYS